MSSAKNGMTDAARAVNYLVTRLLLNFGSSSTRVEHESNAVVLQATEGGADTDQHAPITKQNNQHSKLAQSTKVVYTDAAALMR
jgi:hypothetical protein